MSSFFVGSGDYTYNNFDQGQFSSHSPANSWYQNVYRRYNGDNDESCSFEFTRVGIPSGEYDLAFWAHDLNSSYVSRVQVTVTDGSSTRSRDFLFDEKYSTRLHTTSIEGSWTYSSNQYWKVFAKSVQIFSGTAHVLVKPDPRSNANSASIGWIIQEPFGFIAALPLDVSNDMGAMNYTPTSNKSKPHPLYTN